MLYTLALLHYSTCALAKLSTKKMPSHCLQYVFGVCQNSTIVFDLEKHATCIIIVLNPFSSCYTLFTRLDISSEMSTIHLEKCQIF